MIDTSIVLARSSPQAEADYAALITELRQFWPDLKPIKGQPTLSDHEPWNGV